MMQRILLFNIMSHASTFKASVMALVSVLMMAFMLKPAHVNAQVTLFPYQEGWENGGFGSWSQPASNVTDWENETGGTFSSGTGPSGANEGSNYIHPDASDANPGDMIIIQNEFDLSKISGTPQIVFDYHMYFDGDQTDGQLDVDVSTDGGTTWINEFNRTGGQGNQWYNDENLSLSAYSNDTVKIRFKATIGANPNDYKHDVAIDDVKVQQQPSCLAPSDLSASNISTNAANVSWTSNDTGSNWKVQWGPSGFSLGQGDSSITSNNPYSLSGLMSNTQYDVYVAEICGSGDTSNYSRSLTLKTECQAFTASYSQNFDGAPDADPFTGIDCWAITGNKANEIELEDGSFATNAPPSAPNEVEFGDVDLANGDSAILVSPQFSNLTNYDKRVRFQAAFDDASSNSNVLYVGVMADQSNSSSLVVLDTLTSNIDDAYSEYIVNLNNGGLIGNRDHVAIAAGAGNFDQITIDDFVYETMPACVKPTNLNVSNIATNSANVGWTSNASGNQWKVQWGPSGFTLGQGDSTIASNNPYSLSGLMSATQYDVYVAEICGSGDTSNYAGAGTFQTKCSTYTASYSQNFDGAPEADPFAGINCWATTGNQADEIELEDDAFATNAPPSAPNEVEFGDVNLRNGDTAILVSPEFSDLTNYDKRIRFQAAFENASTNTNKLYIGVMPNQNDNGSFVVLDSITSNTDDVYNEYTVNLVNGGAIGNKDHIAFASGAEDFSFDEITIDDFVYETAPLCVKPSALNTSNTTTNATDVSWNSNASGNQWKVQWGPSGFTLGQGDSAMTSNNPYSITGLMNGTQYDVYVAEICGPGDTSGYAGPLTFSTSCVTLSAPYYENFDTMANGWQAGTGFDNTGDAVNTCWGRTPSSGYFWGLRSGSTGSSSTGPDSDNTTGNDNYVFTEASNGSAGDNALFTSPKVDVSTLNDPRLRFFYHMYGAEMGTLEVEVSNDGGATWNTEFSVSGQQQSSTGAAYTEAQVSLSAYMNDTIQLRFKGIRGAGFKSDIAIDDVFLEENPACIKPTNLNVSNVSSNSADVGWTSNDAGTDWIVQWDTSGFTLGQGNTIQVSNNPYTLSGLMGNTEYDVYVAEICGAGDTSEYSAALTFKTECPAFKASYSQNFDGAPDADPFTGIDCWATAGNQANEIELEDNSIYTDAPPSNPNEVEFGDVDLANGDSAILVAPQFSDLTNYDKRVRFQAAFNDGSSNSNVLYVGVMADQSNSSSFVALDTLTSNTDDAYSEYIVNLNNGGLIGNRDHVAIAAGASSSFDHITIDDFVYETIPSCFQPADLQVGAIDVDSANISWTSNDAGSSWVVEYGQAGFSLGNGTKDTVGSTSYILSGLMNNTSYDVYVQEVCGAGDASNFTGPLNFSTECQPIAAPFSEDFGDAANAFAGWDVPQPGDFQNQGNTIGDCWSRNLESYTDYHWGPMRYNTTTSLTGPDNDHTSGNGNHIFAEASNHDPGDTANIISPLIDLSTISNPTVNFWYYMYGSDIGTLILEVSTDNGATWNKEFSISGEQQISSSSFWGRQLVDLSAYANKTVQVRFRAADVGVRGDISVDDFSIKDMNATMWTGEVSNTWNMTSNWTNGVPDSTTKGIIAWNANGQYPGLLSNADVQTLEIDPGASLTIPSGKTLSVYGNLINNGNKDLGDGMLSFKGSSNTNQVNSILNMTGNSTHVYGASKVASAQIDKPGDVTLQGNLAVENKFEAVEGTMKSSGGMLRLLADMNGAAYLDDFSAGHNGTVNGTIEMEQVAKGGAGWRYMSSPVTNADAGGMHDDVFISAGQTGNVYYYDESSSGNGFTDGWTPISHRSASMGVMQGFDMFFWQESTPGGKVSYPDTFDMAGTPTSGPQSKTLTASGSQWNLVGNPYPSMLNWNKVNLPNDNSIFDGVYIWNHGNAQFETYVNGMSTNGGDSMIAPMQAFFVYANSGPTTLTLDNSARSTGTEDFVGKRKADQNKKIKLEVSDEAGASDEMIVYFDKAATKDFDGNYDAYEFKSRKDAMPNMYSKIGEENASINGLPEIRDGLTVPVRLESGKDAEYTIDASIENLEAGVEVYLEDKATGRMYDLQYAEVDVDHKKGETDRFALRFIKDEATSNDQVVRQSDFTLYSNDNQVVVDFGNTYEGSESAQVKLTSVSGKRVIEEREVVTEGCHKINIGERSEGVYLVEVITEDAVKTEKVFVR